MALKNNRTTSLGCYEIYEFIHTQCLTHSKDFINVSSGHDCYMLGEKECCGFCTHVVCLSFVISLYCIIHSPVFLSFALQGTWLLGTTFPGLPCPLASEEIEAGSQWSLGLGSVTSRGYLFYVSHHSLNRASPWAHRSYWKTLFQAFLPAFCFRSEANTEENRTRGKRQIVDLILDPTVPEGYIWLDC